MTTLNEPFIAAIKWPCGLAANTTVSLGGWSAIIDTDVVPQCIGYDTAGYYNCALSGHNYTFQAYFDGLIYPFSAPVTQTMTGKAMRYMVRFQADGIAAIGGCLMNSVADAKLGHNMVGFYGYVAIGSRLDFWTLDGSGSWSSAIGDALLSLNTDYWVEIGPNGSGWYMKIFASDGVTQIGTTKTLSTAMTVNYLAPGFGFCWANPTSGAMRFTNVSSDFANQTDYSSALTWPADSYVSTAAPLWTEPNGGHTGSLAPSVSTDPGITNVRAYTTYEINNVGLTGICKVPSASQVEHGVVFDTGITGTYNPITQINDPTFVSISDLACGGEFSFIFSNGPSGGTVTLNKYSMPDFAFGVGDPLHGIGRGVLPPNTYNYADFYIISHAPGYLDSNQIQLASSGTFTITPGLANSDVRFPVRNPCLSLGNSGATGTLMVPGVTAVVAPTIFDNGLTGIWQPPTAAQVEFGVVFGLGTTGTFNPGSPNENDVRYLTTYGAGMTGALKVPTAAQVQLGVVFDAPGVTGVFGATTPATPTLTGVAGATGTATLIASNGTTGTTMEIFGYTLGTTGYQSFGLVSGPTGVLGVTGLAAPSSFFAVTRGF